MTKRMLQTILRAPGGVANNAMFIMKATALADHSLGNTVEVVFAFSMLLGGLSVIYQGWGSIYSE